jgi:uncharacterized coiled-coil protein SlyX
MAKKKAEKVIDSVELKPPFEVLTLERIGYRITNENLTIERYQKLMDIAPTMEKFFNVKYKTIKHELESKE